jgi:hypothetical protein
MRKRLNTKEFSDDDKSGARAEEAEFDCLLQISEEQDMKSENSFMESAKSRGITPPVETTWVVSQRAALAREMPSSLLVSQNNSSQTQREKTQKIKVAQGP